MRRRMISGGFAVLGILFLILDSKTAIAGGKDAVELCLYSVIPSIFPFIVMSGVLVSVVNGGNWQILHPIARFLGIPAGTEGIVLAGFLGGYPVGAQSVYRGWKNGHLSKEEATRMLAFSSNAGPSFLFGILGAMFSSAGVLWLLWLIHILSAVGVSLLIPATDAYEHKESPPTPLTITESLKPAVKTMGYICGWILLFRVILAFMDRWVLWILPDEIQVTVYGILELANGCLSLNAITLPGLRFMIASGMLAFGGICVIMQTASVTGELGIGSYMKGKILQTVISTILAFLAQMILFAPDEQVKIPVKSMLIVPLFMLFGWYLKRKFKNKGSIPAIIGV